MKKNKSFLFYSIPLIILLLTIYAIFWFFTHYRIVQWNPSHIKETAIPLSNPYQGWYRMFGYTLSDSPSYTKEELLTSIQKEKENRLVLLLINLKEYSSTPISKKGLNELNTLLSSWQQSGKQLILRFVYDWDGNGKEAEPKELIMIKNHMTQVSSLVNQYASSIYILQGIFVGNYGEMHNSNHMSEDSIKELVQHLHEAIDPNIFLSVRTPAHWRQITSSAFPLSQEAAFTQSLSSRLGLFNDGMLGSETDLGTYESNPLKDTFDILQKRGREEEIDFQKQLCSYVPNGGEVVNDNAYNDLYPAIDTLKNMQVSYLNSMYDHKVHEKWKSTIYERNDLFKQQSGYEYITNHLGYRYVVREVDINMISLLNDKIKLDLSIENVGFSNAYKKFQVELKLKDKETGNIITIPLPTDNRFWAAGEVIHVEYLFLTKLYQSGEYELYLSITDPLLEEEILLANTNYYHLLGIFLGSLSIKTLP